MRTDPVQGQIIRRLKIQLGLHCNARCSYCLQAPFRTRPGRPSDADVQNFLHDLAEHPSLKPELIEIWGGEPLVYPRILRRLIPGLRLLFPDSGLFMSTNGLLLNRSWIDFFLRHRIALGISHDGPGQFLRGRDPLADPTSAEAITALIRERPEMTSFNFVLTPQNFDIESIDRWFYDKFPGLRVQPNVDWIVQIYDERLIDRFSFCTESGGRLSNVIQRRLSMAGRKSFHLERLVASAQLHLEKQARGEHIGFFSDDPGHLTVDLQSQVLANHNFSGSENILGPMVSAAGAGWAEKKAVGAIEHCMACPVFVSCRGQTYRATRALEEINCRHQKYFHSAILAVARERQGARPDLLAP